MARKQNRKFEILQCATSMFLEKGYSPTYITAIAKKLDISTGNLTFYFPSKEHLLAELIRELCQFQWNLMEREVQEDYSPLMAYLLEIVTIAAMCDSNPNVKDIFISAYKHSLPLEIIRGNDTWKTTEVFGEFCRDWTEEDFIQAENIVSGIEYALLRTENTEKISLHQRMASSLEAIMKIYDVPGELRKKKIEKVLQMDYKVIGNNIFNEFCLYVEEENRKALQMS